MVKNPTYSLFLLKENSTQQCINGIKTPFILTVIKTLPSINPRNTLKLKGYPLTKSIDIGAPVYRGINLHNIGSYKIPKCLGSTPKLCRGFVLFMHSFTQSASLALASSRLCACGVFLFGIYRMPRLYLRKCT